MMEFNVFANEVVNRLQEVLGTGYNVCIRVYPKNNGILTRYVCITADGGEFASCLPVDCYYELCRNRKDIPLIVSDMFREYMNRRAQESSFHPDKLYDWNFVRDRILFRLVNSEANRELLQDIPSVEVFNLSRVFYIILEKSEKSRQNILVNNRLMEKWGVDAADLLKQAEINTPAELPEQFMNLEFLLSDVFSDVRHTQLPYHTGIPMYILTNGIRLYGASCMMYNGVLEKISEKLHSGFYVLPSSLHEVILVPADAYDQEYAGQLKDIVITVNLEELQEQDMLSDTVYYYNKETKQLSMPL